jgi:hypothetical protein
MLTLSWRQQSSKERLRALFSFTFRSERVRSLNLKITGVVKIDDQWKNPGDEALGVSEEIGMDLIAKGVGELIPKSQAEIDAEEQAIKDAEAAALAEAERIANAKKEVEKQLKALRKTATELGIEGAADKDAETLTAEIAAVEKK